MCDNRVCILFDCSMSYCTRYVQRRRTRSKGSPTVKNPDIKGFDGNKILEDMEETGVEERCEQILLPMKRTWRN